MWKGSQQGHLNILFSTHYPPSIAISNGSISINQRLSDYSLMINSQNVCIPAHLFNIHETLSLNIPLRKLKWRRTVASLIKMSQNNNWYAFERRMHTNAQHRMQGVCQSVRVKLKKPRLSTKDCPLVYSSTKKIMP